MQPFAEVILATLKSPRLSKPRAVNIPQLKPFINKVDVNLNAAGWGCTACHVQGRPLACTPAQNVACSISITPAFVTRPVNVNGQLNPVEPELCSSGKDPASVKLVFAGANLAAAKDGVAMAVIAEATMPA